MEIHPSSNSSLRFAAMLMANFRAVRTSSAGVVHVGNGAAELVWCSRTNDYTIINAVDLKCSRRIIDYRGIDGYILICAPQS